MGRVLCPFGGVRALGWGLVLLPGLRMFSGLGGGRCSLLCVWGDGLGGASHLALGFSGILYLSSLAGLGKVVCGGEGVGGERGGHAVDLAYPLPALGGGLPAV